MQQAIADSAYKVQQEIESGEQISVGVNKFQIEESFQAPEFKIDESIRKIQSGKIANLKTRRNQEIALQCLQDIKMPHYPPLT